MNLEESLKWADTFGPIQEDPPDGDGQSLMCLAKEVRRIANQRVELLHALKRISTASQCAVCFRDLQIVALDVIAKVEEE